MALCWVVGFLLFHVASFLIHILLLVAVVALIYHFVRKRGAP
ncbi:MAG: lmo0937 family membrane protein [Pseudomonadota bacterium]